MTKDSLLPRKLSWASAFVIVALALLGAGLFLFERCTSLPARTASSTLSQLENAGRQMRDAIVQVAQLQPRVTINDRVYLEQSSPIAELALVSQRIEVEHEFLHTWAGSTKRLRLHGTFTAKAGFDLHQDISVNVTPTSVTVRLPHARLLGLEENKIDVLALENGYWNSVSAGDVQAQIAELTKMAGTRAVEWDLPARAEQSFREQLAARAGRPVEVFFYSPVQRQ